MCTPRPPVSSGPGRTLTGLAVLVTAALVALAPPVGAQTDDPDVFGSGLSGPIGFAQLTDGTVLVAEFDSGRISAYPPGGGARTDFATGLLSPYGLTQLADGRVLVAENGNGRVSAFPAAGGTANRTDFATGLLNPSDVTQLTDGRVLVSERRNRISAFPAAGGTANRTDFATGVTDPLRVRQLSDGRVLVTEFRGGRVSAFPAAGGDANRADFITGLRGPVGVTELSDGRVLVTELGGDRISAFPLTGGIENRTDFATRIRDPYGVTQLADSRVLAASYTAGEVLSYGDALAPTVPCTAAAPLSFDADGSGAVTVADFSATGTEAAGVRHEADGGAGGAAVDLSGCSFVTFDPFAEAVLFSAVTASTVDPGGVYRLTTSGGDQAFGRSDVFVDAPGAFALVEGAVSDGAAVSTVFGRVVAAVVYGRDGSVFGSMRGGLAEPAARTQAASFAAAMAAAFGQATSAETEGGLDLAVRTWPNPSTGRATVAFGLAEGGAVRVSVVDALGREVAVVAEGAFAPGRHEAAVSDLAAGVYVVRVASAEGVRTARFTVAR